MPTTEVTRIIIGGDVMLGRLVKEAIQTYGIDYPMGKIAPLMRNSDLTLVNLECAITQNPHEWPGAPKAFYFGAPPEAAAILKNCGVHVVNLANNHILDYDVQGLLDTLQYLKGQNIVYTGAGANQTEAETPALFQVKNLKFGMVAFCDHQKDFAAQKYSPGMTFLDLRNEEEVKKQFQLGLTKLQKAGVNWPVLSLHWGPNMVFAPSEKFVALAHHAIDMGYKMLFGHSAHIFHGIEIYRDCPIIYSAGDLVDDYHVDEEFENDHQLLFELELTDTKLKRIILHPVFINYCQTEPANEQQTEFIAKRMKILCEAMGTTVEREGEVLIINP